MSWLTFLVSTGSLFPLAEDQKASNFKSKEAEKIQVDRNRSHVDWKASPGGLGPLLPWKYDPVLQLFIRREGGNTAFNLNFQLVNTETRGPASENRLPLLKLTKFPKHSL